MKLNAFFETNNKPAYTQEEHAIAYLYRLVGYDEKINHRYSIVLTDLFQKSLKEGQRSENDIYFHDYRSDFKDILTELSIPLKAQAKNKSLLNYYSFVPELALFGNYVRAGWHDNPWGLGKFIRDMIIHGSSDEASANQLFFDLFDAFNFSETYDEKNEDFFSFLISKEIQEWLPNKSVLSMKSFKNSLLESQAQIKNIEEKKKVKKSKQYELDLKEHKERLKIIETIIDNPDFLKFRQQNLKFKFNKWNTEDQLSPSIRFVDGLKSIIDIKGNLTQFQFVNLISGLLRLSISTHEIWSCENRILMHENLRSLLYKLTLNVSEKKHENISSVLIGQSYNDSIKKVMSNNVKSVDYIALFLKYIEKNKLSSNPNFGIIETLDDLNDFYSNVEKIISGLKGSNLNDFQKYMTNEMNHLLQNHTSKNSIKSHDEFFRHVLKDTENLNDKKNIDKDQFFWLKQYSKNKYIIEPGDGQCLLMTYLTCGKNRSYCSLQDLEHYLNGYSISIKNDENKIVQRLRNMGLVTDNPDSDNGLTIKNPFI